jgi:hypothetical protein
MYSDYVTFVFKFYLKLKLSVLITLNAHIQLYMLLDYKEQNRRWNCILTYFKKTQLFVPLIDFKLRII